MKQTLILLALVSAPFLCKAGIEASNTPTVSLLNSDTFLIVHGGPVSQTSVANVANTVAPYMSLQYSNLVGTLPAIVTLTNSFDITFALLSTNIVTFPNGNTQTNYIVYAQATGLSCTITNTVGGAHSNILSYVRGILQTNNAF